MAKKKPIHKRIKKHHVYGFAVVAIALGISASFMGYLSQSGPVSAACSGVGPGTPANVVAKSGPQSGQTTLTWMDVPAAKRYTIVYGTKSNNYTFGVANIPAQTTTPTQSLTISNLNSGTTYYYTVTAARGCVPGAASAEVSAVAQ